MNTLVIIPTYNEEKTIASLISGLRQEGFESILIVDDGNDDTARIAVNMKAKVLKGFTKRGVGAAIKRGLTWAKSQGFTHAAVIDAGGTHDPIDLAGMAFVAGTFNLSLVIGSRFCDDFEWRGIRTLVSRIAAFLMRPLVGPIKDVSNGMRIYDLSLLNRWLYLSKSNGFDFQLEALYFTKVNGGTIREFPIPYLLTISTFNWRLVVQALNTWSRLVFYTLRNKRMDLK